MSLNANLTAVMRTNVPIEMRGRVFSARDTIQYSTIPIGLFLDGLLADHVFEPFMTAMSPLQEVLIRTGRGSGVAIKFFIVGTIGSITSLTLKKRLADTEITWYDSASADARFCIMFITQSNPFCLAMQMLHTKQSTSSMVSDKEQTSRTGYLFSLVIFAEPEGWNCMRANNTFAHLGISH